MTTYHEAPVDWTLDELAFEVEYWLDQILPTINHYERVCSDWTRFNRRELRWWESAIYEVIKDAWRVLRHIPGQLRELRDGGTVAPGKAGELARSMDTTFTEVLNLVHLFEVRGCGPWFWDDSVRDSWELRFVDEFRGLWRLLAGIPDQLRALDGPASEVDPGLRGLIELDMEYVDLDDLDVEFTDLAGDPDWPPYVAQLEMEGRVTCVTISRWPNENYVLRRAWKPLHIDLETVDHDEAIEISKRLLEYKRLFPDSEDWWTSLSVAALRYYPDPSPRPRVRLLA